MPCTLDGGGFKLAFAFSMDILSSWIRSLACCILSNNSDGEMNVDVFFALDVLAPDCWLDAVDMVGGSVDKVGIVGTVVGDMDGITMFGIDIFGIDIGVTVMFGIGIFGLTPDGIDIGGIVIVGVVMFGIGIGMTGTVMGVTFVGMLLVLLAFVF